MANTNARDVILAALADAGFKADFSLGGTIGLDTDPLFMDHDTEARYMDAVRKIPGVVGDEGQGEGYEFEVDLAEFTPDSERRLRKLVERYRKKCTPAPAGE